jgi:MFS family permease
MSARAFANATLVPDSKAGRRLALAALIDSLGTGMFLSSCAVYLTRVVGLSPAQVGLGLSVAGLAGLSSSVPLGVLADRMGPGRIYLALQLLRAFGYAAYVVVSGFASFVVVATIIEVGDAAIPAVAQATVGLAVGDAQRLSTLAKVRAVRNLGFGIGAAGATAVLALGSRAAFLTMILVNVAAILLSARTLHRIRLSAVTTASGTSRQFEPVRDPSYLAAALLSGVLSVHMSLLFVGLPLWLAQHTRVPVAMIGVLVVINTAMAMALQARFARAAERLAGALDCMVRAGLALAGFALVAYLLGRVDAVIVCLLLAVLAVVLLTCAELWQSAGSWAISHELAPTDRLSQYLATFQLGTGIQVMAAPAVVVGVVFPHSLGWLGLGVVTAATGLLIRPAVRAPR